MHDVHGLRTALLEVCMEGEGDAEVAAATWEAVRLDWTRGAMTKGPAFQTTASLATWACTAASAPATLCKSVIKLIHIGSAVATALGVSYCNCIYWLATSAEARADQWPSCSGDDTIDMVARLKGQSR